MSAGPAWLPDEPELQALLHAVLDLFDQQPANARQRPILIPAERYLATLARNDGAADQLWALVEMLEREGVLRIRDARRAAYDSRWRGAKLAFALECEETLRHWLDRAPTERAMHAWHRAVSAQASSFPGSCEVLLQRRIAIGGRSPDEVVAALARIGTLTGPATLRQMSAFAFWGDSKVLDGRGDLVAALFPRLEVVDRAIVIAIHLPRDPSGVLFIENQDTYTAAIRGVPEAAHGLALVFASGFRGSAQRIRARSGALLHFTGPGAGESHGDFEQWWFETGEPAMPCFFWGDLDFAGMQILKSLRQRFGDVPAWRPGYQPMLEALRILGGYRGGDELRGQVDPLATGCKYADEFLLPAIRQYGQLDQEFPLATLGPGTASGG